MVCSIPNWSVLQTKSESKKKEKKKNYQKVSIHSVIEGIRTFCHEVEHEVKNKRNKVEQRSEGQEERSELTKWSNKATKWSNEAIYLVSLILSSSLCSCIHRNKESLLLRRKVGLFRPFPNLIRLFRSLTKYSLLIKLPSII